MVQVVFTFEKMILMHIFLGDVSEFPMPSIYFFVKLSILNDLLTLMLEIIYLYFINKNISNKIVLKYIFFDDVPEFVTLTS